MGTAAAIVGMIGGMSWESSSLYYQLINREVHRRLGRQHNARSLLFTLDFDELDVAAGSGDWGLVADRVTDAAQRLEKAGADFIIITSVTGHIVFADVQAAVDVPLLHIADSVKGNIRVGTPVGLLGTKFTLTMQHLIGPLENYLGLQVFTPPPEQIDILQHIISDELQQGHVVPASQRMVREMAAGLAVAGAEAVILGCTELPLLMRTQDYPLPALNLVQLHVEAAVNMLLQ